MIIIAYVKGWLILSLIKGCKHPRNIYPHDNFWCQFCEYIIEPINLKIVWERTHYVLRKLGHQSNYYHINEKFMDIYKKQMIRE